MVYKRHSNSKCKYMNKFNKCENNKKYLYTYS